MYHFAFDDETGVLYATVGGYWTMEIADRYILEQESHWNDARRKAGHLKLLVDATATTVQSPAVMERIQSGRDKALKPNEKAAIVVASHLSKLQTKRAVGAARVGVFTSLEDAKKWLLDDSQETAA